MPNKNLSPGEQLRRLQEIAAKPGYIEKSMKAAARTESAYADEMERGLVIERSNLPNSD